MWGEKDRKEVGYVNGTIIALALLGLATAVPKCGKQKNEPIDLIEAALDTPPEKLLEGNKYTKALSAEIESWFTLGTEVYELDSFEP